MRILIVFGGPSLERAISLNSARSLADHLYSFAVQQVWVYVSEMLEFHIIDKKWLYCNTIEDFAFKLPKGLLWETFLEQCHKDDIIFSLIHGAFGEDGTFSSWLEKAQLSFIGPSAYSCQMAYLKERGLNFLTDLGLAPGPYIYLESQKDLDALHRFMAQFPEGQKFFMKPNAGGSSIGVRPFNYTHELVAQWQQHPQYYQKGLVVEPFYELAEEFCITVLGSDNAEEELYCLAPIRIDYDTGEFYDYRKKYMLSDHSYWECPADFPSSYIQEIQNAAKMIYKHLKARGILRLDGWVFQDGRVAFSDINLISGFEQNSLLFRQAAVCGLSHQALCCWLIDKLAHQKIDIKSDKQIEKETVFVVFGGKNSERYTSMLSGINVWLKLVSQNNYHVVPYIWDGMEHLHPVPYHAMLSHGIEGLRHASTLTQWDLAPYRLPFADLLPESQNQTPCGLSLGSFLSQARRHNAFVFLALHGAEGENGQWQNWLIQAHVPFNGSGVDASDIGMDKKKTADVISSMAHPKIMALPKMVFSLEDDTESLLQKALEFQKSYALPWVIKPRSEGCSSGVLILHDCHDFELFIKCLQKKSLDYLNYFSDGFLAQWERMEHCLDITDWLLEPMVQCDTIVFDNHIPTITTGEGWIELTQAMMQEGSEWKVLPASLVIAQKHILSVEEKFQNGTGTNITPVPFFTQDDHRWLSRAMIQVAQALGVEQYARFDLFYHRHTRDIIIIEVNTLPGLTASTVLFHQLILEDISPQEFFAWVVDRKNQPQRVTSQKISQDGIAQLR